METIENNRVSHIAKHYDNIETAEHYYSFENPRNLRERVSHKQFLVVLSNLDFFLCGQESMALDIGCSSGRYIQGLKKKGINAIGIDTAIIALKYAAERIDSNFVRATGTNLPFNDRSFDLVICIELLHHFEDNVLEKIIEEISGVVKPGGLFVFDVKNKLSPFLWYKYKRDDSIKFTLKARTIDKMTKYAEKYGFEIIKKKGILFPLAILAPFVIIFSKKRLD